MNAPSPPKCVTELPAGYQLRTACGRMSTVHADFDFETYSEAGTVRVDLADGKTKWVAPPGVQPSKKGLSCVGAAVYAEHPSTDILMLAYDLKDSQGKRQWFPGMPAPVDLFDYLARGGIIAAWNIAFEYWIWQFVGVRKYGWPALPVTQLRCDMGKARAWALPGSLDLAASVANTSRKDAAGSALIKRFTVPQNSSKANGMKTRITGADDPEKFADFARYNLQDIRAEAEISALTPDLTPVELEYWHVDQTINRRGVYVDLETVEAMRAILVEVENRYTSELMDLTGGIRPTELAQLQGWLAAQGFRIAKMDEEHIAAAMARDDLAPHVRRALELRALSGSASVKKTHSFVNMAMRDSRVRDLFQFHAARTGRPTGGGVQPTNMPKAGPDVWLCKCGKHYYAKRPACPWCGGSTRVNRKGVPLPPSAKPDEWSWRASADAIEIIQLRSLSLLELFFGEGLTTIAGCLRAMFTAAPGYDLVSSDYTAIEAVVLAALAGEQWRVDLFRAKGKIYEKSASLVTGVPYEEMLEYEKRTGSKHPHRQIGKVAELALGYQGWITAWLQFDKNCTLTEEEIKGVILKWRAASPAIVEFWGGQSRRVRGRYVEEFFGVEGAFITAALNGRAECRGLIFERFYRDERVCVQIRLLSGRYLTYHNVTLSESDRPGARYAISYEGYNSNPTNGPVGWIEMRTWGGKLVENIVQAVSNDLLRFASVNLERAGYPLVLHVYDEIVSEIPEGFGSVEEFESIMATVPDWATGWPVFADGGYRAKRYRKG